MIRIYCIRSFFQLKKKLPFRSFAHFPAGCVFSFQLKSLCVYPCEWQCLIRHAVPCSFLFFGLSLHSLGGLL